MARSRTCGKPRRPSSRALLLSRVDIISPQPMSTRGDNYESRHNKIAREFFSHEELVQKPTRASERQSQGEHESQDSRHRMTRPGLKNKTPRGSGILPVGTSDSGGVGGIGRL